MSVGRWTRLLRILWRSIEPAQFQWREPTLTLSLPHNPNHTPNPNIRSRVWLLNLWCLVDGVGLSGLIGGQDVNLRSCRVACPLGCLALPPSAGCFNHNGNNIVAAYNGTDQRKT